MPSPITAYELIVDAMKTAKIISTGVGETPTADEANDGLKAMNDLLESMSLDNLFVYGAANEVFTTIGGQASYTIGPTGNFVTTRPIRISGAYCTYQGLDYTISIIGQAQYDAILLKTMQQQIVEQLFYINDFPNGIIRLYPTPSQAISLSLSTDRVLPVIPNLVTLISLPPGYLLFMKNALAMMLAPEYGITIDDTITGIAHATRAQLKRANKQKVIANFDSTLKGDGYVYWQSGWP